MIGKLKGIVDSLDENHVLVDVGGVGYQVFASSHTLRGLSAGEAATLYIITHVREDHIHLYGFLEQEEREWFNLLTTVNGVGSKVGMALLSALTPAQLHRAIAAQDKAALTQAAGVGGRLAERILTELKGKTEKMMGSVGVDAIALTAVAKKGGVPGKAAANNNVPSDAISALTNLGYNRSDAYSVVQRIWGANPEIALESLIRQGLKELVA